jgi:hypothetical protein
MHFREGDESCRAVAEAQLFRPAPFGFFFVRDFLIADLQFSPSLSA